MGYHVKIINSSLEVKKNEKVLNDLPKLTEILVNDFNFFVSESNGEIVFNYTPNDDFSLFYEDGELLANITNDDFIEKMIEISKFFNDGSRVRGDEGETYRSLFDTYYHSDDIDEEILKFPLYRVILDRFRGFLFLIFILVIILTFRYFFDILK